MRFSQSLYQMNAGTESRRTSISRAAVGRPTRRRGVARRRTVYIASIAVMQLTLHIAWLAPSERPINVGTGQGKRRPEIRPRETPRGHGCGGIVARTRADRPPPIPPRGTCDDGVFGIPRWQPLEGC